MLRIGCLACIAVLAMAGPLSADDNHARFYRGLNLNGPAVVIDGHPWDGKDAKNYVCNGASFENQKVKLRPAIDRNRALMLRSSRWGRSIEVKLTDIPSGDYQVFLYVWEDTDPTRYQIQLNGQTVVKQFDSGTAGAWKKLGPWRVKPVKGVFKIAAQGGDANLSGIEIWRGLGLLPGAGGTGFANKPTPDQLHFFEQKIRPLLIRHCSECHSATANSVGGNLLLDSRSTIRSGGDSGPPIVPGQPAESLLIGVVRQTEPGLSMPPKKREPLSETEIADLETWIRMGAPDPRARSTAGVAKSRSGIDWEQGRTFWSFQPMGDPAPPPVKNAAWPANEIDRFILARLEQAPLTPAPDADPRTLLRRLTFDLIGLPPTPDEVEAFVADHSPAAYARVVERLLASPQYGERWGRHWLDVVRYADTAGDNSDFPIPQMHKYRDWVIAAFNRDMPYDAFVRAQLAGDLLNNSDEFTWQEGVIATGYIANARRFGSVVKGYPQYLTIEDTLDNLGRAFLGLTINCARCHDHKFDPISTQDYYGLYGIFASTRYPWPGIELEQKQRDLVPLVSPAEAEAAIRKKREEQKRLDAEVKRLERDLKKADKDQKSKLEKSLKQAKDAATRFSRTPLPIEQAYGVADAAQIADAAVQRKGDPAKPGPIVHRRFLTILGGAEVPPNHPASGRRLLADWIVSPDNPLTARVLVNRIWLYHFGKGIVSTPNDFGKQGRSPTHPKLLDFLARRMLESGWSIKSLHRLIVLSRTYRLASRAADALSPRDPNNDLLSSFPQHRLDAEAIRDLLLTLGGNLDPTPGGAHPFPPQTEWKFTQHNPFKAVYDTHRRSVYLMTQRIQRHPYLGLFDGADASASTPQRLTSTTPLQALYLLNDAFVHEQAQGFAAKLIKAGRNDAAGLDRAYRLALGRPPQPEESKAGVSFLNAVRKDLKKSGMPEDKVEAAAWEAYARVIFRLNELVYID